MTRAETSGTLEQFYIGPTNFETFITVSYYWSGLNRKFETFLLFLDYILYIGKLFELHDFDGIFKVEILIEKYGSYREIHSGTEFKPFLVTISHRKSLKFGSIKKWLELGTRG